LHFTGKMVEQLKETGISATEITLHVSAGTFKPIKSNNIADHEMHCEHFFVTRETVELLRKCQGRIIPVGTTSVRTLESLYWLGIKLARSPLAKGEELLLGQWDAYDDDPLISSVESLEIILKHMQAKELSVLNASTNIMIIPGYKFRLINGMITNFHQPMSSLLLLVSAWVGEKWKEIYRYALENDFRFLSYGDCSLLLRQKDEI